MLTIARVRPGWSKSQSQELKVFHIRGRHRSPSAQAIICCLLGTLAESHIKTMVKLGFELATPSWGTGV